MPENFDSLFKMLVGAEGKPEVIAAVKAKLTEAYAIDQTYTKTSDATGKAGDPGYVAEGRKYSDPDAQTIYDAGVVVKQIEANNKLLSGLSAVQRFPTDPTGTPITTGFSQVTIGDIVVSTDGTNYFASGERLDGIRTSANAQIKTNSESIKSFQTLINTTKQIPQTLAAQQLQVWSNLLVSTGVRNADTEAAETRAAERRKDERKELLDDRAADATRSSKITAEQTVTTMVTTNDQGKLVLRQFLKNGKFVDSEGFNPSDKDIMNSLYIDKDGSIAGSIDPVTKKITWSYKPPQLIKTGTTVKSVEFNPATQTWDGAETVVSSEGDKLELYNGQLYKISVVNGVTTITKMEGVPAISEAQAKQLGIEERNATTAEGRAAMDATTSKLAQEKTQLDIDAAKAAKKTGAEIIAGTLTVIEGLIKSGTPADLAKAQELYQSARKDWEVEKKNAIERRDKAQGAGLRRSGMMFLRGATAVQGGKTGADAQQMWREEYNRTPGKEGESYTQRMARSLGLGADLDQNLDTTFPAFADYAKGVTSSVVPAAVAAAGPAAAGSAADGRVPVERPSVRVPGDITEFANVLTPLGLAPQIGTTNYAGYTPFNTVSYTGTGPGDVPAQPLFQGQVAVAPNSVPPQGYQTGLNDVGQYLPMQVYRENGTATIPPFAPVPTGMAPTSEAPPRDMSNNPEAARMTSNYQGGGQGYYQAPAPEGTSLNKLAELHNMLNGGRGGM